jgi:3-oxoacyl-[acyl-carrier-protein] synthase II
VESVATLLALQRRVAPPTLNYEVAEEGLDLDYVPGTSRPLFDDEAGNGHRPVAISNAFGFGGHNSVLVLAAAE